MKFIDWLEHSDGRGGIVPSNIKRAKRVDLITLPEDVKGTNCGNCKWINEGFCTHPEVKMHVNDRMCCAEWDNKGVKRPWN